MNQQQFQAIISQLQRTHNPKQLLQQLSVNNPVMKDLFSLAEKGDLNSLEQFARDEFKAQGRDFDKEFSEFINNFKGIN